MEHWDAIATARRTLADQLEALTPEQWATQSLCAAWSVRDVVAHLVMPHKVTMARFLITVVRNGGSFARANIALTATEAVRPPEDLIRDLRGFAGSRFAPPGLDSAAPLTDVLVHGQDIRVPLALPDPNPIEAWTAVLDFLVSRRARRGFVGALPAVRWAATDGDWAHGTGPEVRGPAAALALAITGRTARIGELSGPGVPAVAGRPSP